MTEEIINPVADTAIKLLQQYSDENFCLVRSTIDLSPLEQWLILQIHNLRSTTSEKGDVVTSEEKNEINHA